MCYGSCGLTVHAINEPIPTLLPECCSNSSTYVPRERGPVNAAVSELGVPRHEKRAVDYPIELYSDKALIDSL